MTNLPNTLKEFWSFAGDSEDFEYYTDAYYIMRAIEHHGSAVRDNNRDELIAIGKRVDAVESELE